MGHPLAIVFAGALALAAFGCGGSSKPACTPDLTVVWRIKVSSRNGNVTCADVGATTVRVSVDGQPTDVPCPADQSEGSATIALDVAGPHPVTVALLDGGTQLALASPGSFDVDCSGNTETIAIVIDVGDICSPDLTIPWRIVSNLNGAVLTCLQAGNASGVIAQIDGGGLTVLTDFPGGCPTSGTTGTLVAQVPAPGSYNASLRLLGAGGTLLSETGVLVQPVDCSGLSATPRADLLVNF
jgi:hypothetical protein